MFGTKKINRKFLIVCKLRNIFLNRLWLKEEIPQQEFKYYIEWVIKYFKSIFVDVPISIFTEKYIAFKEYIKKKYWKLSSLFFKKVNQRKCKEENCKIRSGPKLNTKHTQLKIDSLQWIIKFINH